MSPDRSQARVFVVDDESVIASTLGMILSGQGFDAHAFHLPNEALRVSRDMAPDLLITDVVMPELSGIDLAIQTRELYPNCKVLLFSGQPAITGMLEAARASGHNFEVLAKPIHPGELLEKIRVVMDS
jgi:DNA-binding NtrC family response regulator